MVDRRPDFVTVIARMTVLNCRDCRVFESNKYLLLMQNLASIILCIFVTGGAYAPYAPCLYTPLDRHTHTDR